MSWTSLSAQSSVETVAREVLEADSVHNWRLLLALTHPDALARYRHDRLAEFDAVRFLRPGSDTCFRHQLTEFHSFLLDSVYLVPSLDSLARLSPDSLFARVERYGGGWSHQIVVDTLAPTRTIIGHVQPNDSTAYVVLEERYSHQRFLGSPETHAEIMSFKLYHGAWRTLDSGIGQGLRDFKYDSRPCS